MAKTAFPKWRAEKEIKATYRQFFGQELATNPDSFTGKVYIRMINEVRNPNSLLSTLADKHEARRVVGEIIGEKYLIPVIWSGRDPAKIPFNSLTNRSIAKVTHGSGSNIVLTCNSDPGEVVNKLNDYLKMNHYWYWREHWYLPIKGRVQIEKFLDDGHTNGPLDYRFWCFNGEPAVVQVDDCKHGINPFYDLEWNKLDLSYRPNAEVVAIDKPEGLGKMIELARVLSAGFGYVRVDFFNIHGQIYFSEMTFAPVAGQINFNPREWDIELGKLWSLQDPRTLDQWRLNALEVARHTKVDR